MTLRQAKAVILRVLRRQGATVPCKPKKTEDFTNYKDSPDIMRHVRSCYALQWKYYHAFRRQLTASARLILEDYEVSNAS